MRRLTSKTYTYGCSAGGQNKRRYFDYSYAVAELLRIAEEQRLQGAEKVVKDVYKCGACGGYHHTSEAPGVEVGDSRGTHDSGTI